MFYTISNTSSLSVNEQINKKVILESFNKIPKEKRYLFLKYANKHNYNEQILKLLEKLV